MPSSRDQRPYNVRYYQRNRQRELDRVMTRQRATLDFLRDLRRVPCMDCVGEYFPHQMDFDHRDPGAKEFNLTSSRAMLISRERLLQELAKCDIVCANCHAVRTFALQSKRLAERSMRGELLTTPRSARMRRHSAPKRDLLLTPRERPCHDFGVTYPPIVMQFDHRDPSGKSFNVAQSWCRATDAVLKEASKCDIVCRNCHRDRTFRRRLPQAGVV